MSAASAPVVAPRWPDGPARKPVQPREYVAPVVDVRADNLLGRHVVRLAVVLANVVDGDDVPVVEASRGSRLAQNALPQLGAVGPRHLDDDRPVDGGVTSDIHHAHAAAAEPLDNAVAPDG